MKEQEEKAKDPQGQSVITLRNVSKRYQPKKHQESTALYDINLDIAEGEFVCLLGPSGCGKSTLLKIIAGLEEASEGNVSLDGQEIVEPHWQCGVVFQHPPLYPWLNVEQNVSFGLRMRHLDKEQIRQRTQHYLEQVGLSEFAKFKPYELSGGMRQRVSIARSLINEPRVLLMDEPFGALDALTRGQMQSLIRGIWADTHKTILFITHDVDEALLLGTRVLVMSKHPGHLTRAFNNLEFTYHIAENDADGLRFSKEFKEIRLEILSLINGFTEYSI